MIEIYDTNDRDFERVVKGWGEEVILHNDENYCAKLLRFKAGCKFSLHFHIIKTETWYVNKGEVWLNFINTETAQKHHQKLNEGMMVEVEPGQPHQLEAITDVEIFEASTPHYDEDSYRIEPGDSQRP